MMHVAEAGENRGRVVIQLGSGSASPVAIDAAIWLAKAFQSEIESLFVESEQLIEMANHPFAREVAWSGKTTGGMSAATIERHFRFTSAAFHQQIQTRASAAEVPCRQRVIRGEPVAALATACRERGPWNVVALAEPFTSADSPELRRLVETVAGSTGLLLVGPRARGITGPIVLALEDIDKLPAMLAVAERLASVTDTAITVCLIAADEMALAQLEGQARLLMTERPQIVILPATVMRGSTAAVAEALRRLSAGLVVGQFGGDLFPSEGDLRPLAESLACPLLLLW